MADGDDTAKIRSLLYPGGLALPEAVFGIPSSSRSGDTNAEELQPASLEVGQASDLSDLQELQAPFGRRRGRGRAPTNGGPPALEAFSAPSVLRIEKTGKSGKRIVRDMMFDAFGIEFGTIPGHPNRNQKIDDEPVAGTHAGGKVLARLSQKDSAIELRRGKPLTLQPRDAFDGCRMRNPKPAGNVGGSSLSLRAEQIID
jgi:hypothetical protein